MVFLARKVRSTKKISDATLVVVTDRTDLDKQIFETFQNNLTNTTPVRSESIGEMKELLRNSNAQIITTTIQKFQSEKEEDNIVGLSDEEKNNIGNLYFEKRVRNTIY